MAVRTGERLSFITVQLDIDFGGVECYLIGDEAVESEQFFSAKSKGGGDYYENYQLLCGSCNRIKGDRPMEYLRLKIETIQRMTKQTIVFGE